MPDEGQVKLPWRFIAEWTDLGEACVREVRRVYLEARTPYQEFVIAELAGIGKSLVIDGKVQSSISDEHWYHEALVHPPLLVHSCPRRVLIIGGGEGATAREVLRHRCVEEAVMVDIDGELIEAARRYLPEWSMGAFEDPRLKLVIDDGLRYVERALESGESFDAIILDLVDPTEGGPAAQLYTFEFYQRLKRLAPEGIVVTQATSLSHTPHVAAVIRNTLARVFRLTRVYGTYVRAYNGLWGFVAASDVYDPGSLDAREVERRLRERVAGPLRFYDGETHVWMMNLPKPVREILDSVKDHATMERPVFVPV